ncbi:MAG: cytochrome c [Acidobacteria bacterium]|nr:cytochrome c [Acidobacteriota bacterium]
MKRGLHRRVVFGIVVGAVAVFAVSASRAQDQRSQPGAAPALNVPSGDAKKGSALYLATGCWECHGYTGATGTGAPLVITGLSASGFVNYIRNPRTPAMPLYSAKVISDVAAADLYAYIKTFKKPADAKDIALLQQIMNEQ